MNLQYEGSLFEYLANLLDLYNKENQYLYMLVYLASLAVLIIFIRREKIKSMLVFPMGIFFFLLLNPVVFTFLSIIRVVASGRFYRIFWVLPIAITIAYVITYFITKFKKKVVIVFLVVAACVLLPLFGDPERVTDLRKDVKNEYKIPQVFVQVSEFIHEDFGEGQPVLYYDNYFLRNYRTYDANVISARTRVDYEEIDYYDAVEGVCENIPYNVLNYVIIQDNKDFLPAEEFAKYTKDIDYIICDEDDEFYSYFVKAGFNYLDTIRGYEIYKVR